MVAALCNETKNLLMNRLNYRCDFEIVDNLAIADNEKELKQIHPRFFSFDDELLEECKIARQKRRDSQKNSKTQKSATIENELGGTILEAVFNKWQQNNIPLFIEDYNKKKEAGTLMPDATYNKLGYKWDIELKSVNMHNEYKNKNLMIGCGSIDNKLNKENVSPLAPIILGEVDLENKCVLLVGWSTFANVQEGEIKKVDSGLCRRVMRRELFPMQCLQDYFKAILEQGVSLEGLATKGGE